MALRTLAAIVAVLLLAGCGGTSDADRIDRLEVDGQECVVVRAGTGRVIAIDCDWSAR